MGSIFDKTAYNWKTEIKCFDTDMYRRLKLSSLLKLHQEVGERHLMEMGTSSNDLLDNQNISFIFTKLCVSVNRMPKLEEDINITTWCSALKGVRFTRNYIVSSNSGEILTQCKGEVTVINVISRKIVRPKDIQGSEKFLYNDALPCDCSYPDKIRPFDDGKESFRRSIKFTDIDYNGHVNNTVYADMIYDVLPWENTKDNIKEFQINFINEIKPSSDVDISCKDTENGFLFTGRTGSDVNFTASIKF